MSWTCSRCASFSTAPPRFAPLRLLPVRSAPLRIAPDRSAPVSTARRSFAPREVGARKLRLLQEYPIQVHAGQIGATQVRSCQVAALQPLAASNEIQRQARPGLPSPAPRAARPVPWVPGSRACPRPSSRRFARLRRRACLCASARPASGAIPVSDAPWSAATRWASSLM